MESFRFIHSADWHLGHSFLDETERLKEHRLFFDELLRILKTEEADALIVSGDIFDQANPSSKAQTLLYDFLNQAHAALPFLTILLLCGNHDSAARLMAPQSVLRAFNVQVIGNFVAQDCARYVLPLKNKYGHEAAMCLAVPFLRLGDVWSWVENKENKSASAVYAEGVAALYQELMQIAQKKMGQKKLPIIATGHCYVTGSTLSLDSERYLSAGGQEGLSTSIFPKNLAYVALGHLHKAQQVGENIFYSGSVLPLSFTERHYQHQVRSVLLEKGSVKKNEPIFLSRAVDFWQWPEKSASTKSEILNKINQLKDKHSTDDAQTYPFLKIRLKMDPNEMHAGVEIRKALENKAVRLMHLEWVEPTSPAVEKETDDSVFNPISAPEDLFARLYKMRFHTDLPQEWLDAFLSLTAQIESEAQQ